MGDTSKRIFVYADWKGKEPELIGILHAERGRGKEIISFEYEVEWLERADENLLFDPELKFYQGRQYVPLQKAMFGVFSDSCPDRWGRLLMKRREAIEARKEKRKPRLLLETDYLLGVFDESRMGALRFSLKEGGPFLSYDKTLATPPWTTLRRLENASRSFEEDESGLQEKWLNQLLAPGSSLGGARPKATVQAPDGALWIAKFPSKYDEYNCGAWEMVVHDLAEKCGLNVPEAKLERFSQNGSTFLVKRFDREENKRVHFTSAMTVLGKTDGDSSAEGGSYLELASFIRASGASAAQDLKELWKRIVFSMAVSNTDDHLRNHGFLLKPEGWRLSPAYDINPNIYGDNLSLNINQTDATIDFELAIESAGYYGIDKKSAGSEVEEIKNIVEKNWEIVARSYDLSRSEIEYMRPAFEMDYK